VRILYISTDFGVPVLGFKGASVHIRELTDALAELGHEVVVMTPNVGEGNTTRAQVVHVAAPHLPPPVAPTLCRLGAPWGRGKQLERETRELYYNVEFLRAAQRLAAQWHPDLVYERYALFGLAGSMLARRLGLPHLLEVNAPLRLERRRGPGLVLDGPARWCERRIFGTARHVLCVSRPLAAYVNEKGGRPGRVHIQPNGVNVAKFHADDRGAKLRAQLGFSNEDVVVGFVGSLKPWHGVEHLVEAFAGAQVRGPNLRLLIVGDGPVRSVVERLITEGGLAGAVRLVGNVAHSDVPGYLAVMDIAAAPYVAIPDFYFSPLKVFEYMAAGSAVIAPRLGQIPELVCNGKTGLLYAPGDRPELVEGLVTLAQHADLRARLGARAAEEVRIHHTWEAIARRVVVLGEAEEPCGRRVSA
jgi:glycosyltransferase involved in cell wall biosynthesis